MDREKITYRFSPNFLGDTILYSADLLSQLWGYKDKFPGLQELHADIKELSYFALAYPEHTKAINFLNDNTRLELILTFHCYYDQKGKKTGRPSPSDFYHDVKFLLDRAVDEYRKITGQE